MLGGTVVKVGERIFDGSIRRKLARPAPAAADALSAAQSMYNGPAGDGGPVAFGPWCRPGR